MGEALSDRDNRRGSTFARLMRDEHSESHGGAFAIGNAVGIFANGLHNGEVLRARVRDALHARGIRIIGTGITQDDEDDHWVMLVEAPDTMVDELTLILRDAVRVDIPEYPNFQFQPVR